MADAGRGRPDPLTEQQPPTQFANVPPPPAMLDRSFTLQVVMELQKLVAEIGAKTDRLITDVAGQGEKIDAVRHQISFVRGVLWVFGFLVVIMGSLITLYISGKLAITIKP